jgi:hypothetical protein
MKRLNPLTITEHQEIGAELNRIRLYLITLGCRVSHIYGKTSKVGKAAGHFYRHTDKLRNLMENQMFIDCPLDAHTQVYYGHNIPSHHAPIKRP